jgi:hypothetical protein
VYLEHVKGLRPRTIAIWVLIAGALAISIYILWATQQALGGGGICRCGERPPL